MARINIFGDFKANQVKHLDMSGELVYLLNTSDINMVNFEAPVRSKGKAIKKSGPNICQDVDAPEWLELRGFNAISVANNHTLDFGEVGLKATKDAFKKATVMGAGSWEEAYKMHTYKTKDGLTVGVICCTHCEFGTLMAKDESLKANVEGCAWSLSAEVAKKIMGGAKKCDFLIVFQHGGVEYMDQPLPEWREQYKLWIDMGADAVIASHPHVPQGWEMYKGKPICYSLGNFCFTQLNKKKAAPEHWFESLVCSLEIAKPHECKMEIRPIVYDPATDYICDNEDKVFAEHLEKMNATLQDEKKYNEEVMKDLKKRLPFYLGQFSRGGMVTSIFSKGFLKGIAEGLMGRDFFGKHHAINNIRCESHRWAILRALQAKG